MTLDDLVSETIGREGWQYAEPPTIDQPTGPGGITLPALSADLGRPATLDELKALTVTAAHDIIRRRFERDLADRNFRLIAFEPLRVQLLDFAHNSGSALAVRWLQRSLEMPEAFVDGVIGPRTLAALTRFPPVLVNNALAASRARAALNGGVAAKFANGVALRAVSFTLSTIGDHDGE